MKITLKDKLRYGIIECIQSTTDPTDNKKIDWVNKTLSHKTQRYKFIIVNDALIQSHLINDDINWNTVRNFLKDSNQFCFNAYKQISSFEDFTEAYKRLMLALIDISGEPYHVWRCTMCERKMAYTYLNAKKCNFGKNSKVNNICKACSSLSDIKYKGGKS